MLGGATSSRNGSQIMSGKMSSRNGSLSVRQSSITSSRNGPSGRGTVIDEDEELHRQYKIQKDVEAKVKDDNKDQEEALSK